MVLEWLRVEGLGMPREMAGWGWGREGDSGLAHKWEASPRLLWAELPSWATVAQKRPMTSSSWGSWCMASGCWVIQYLRAV